MHWLSGLDRIADPQNAARISGIDGSEKMVSVASLVIIAVDSQTPASSSTLQSDFLCADVSSAFNSLQTHISVPKLSSRFHLDQQLVMCTLDFLTNGSQRVLVNNSFSDLHYTSADPTQRRF